MSQPDAPDLLERHAELAAFQQLLQRASVQGQVVLVAGEAGVGKTSLLRAAAAAHAAAGGDVWWGACDALQTPLALAPLLDIAREHHPRFAARLEGPRPALFEAVLDELRHASPPSLLVVVEDAHWADDATLDLLKYLGRRIERTHAVLAVSYRDDEVTLAHPLRRVLGELPPAARVLIEVPRLSERGVAELARRLGADAAGVHAATGGNAFFATELLRADRRPHGAVPRSVHDVVLARFAALPAPVQELLRAVAVLPGRAERWLVDALVAPRTEDLDAALASGLLEMDGPWLAYRHELARVAVESALSPALHQAWHARALQALAAGSPTPPAARLVHHAVHAHDVAAISRHAPVAAAEARARGALREFGAHWRVAIQQGCPRDEAERIDWLAGFVSACGVNVWYRECLDALKTLERLLTARGDLARAALARAQQTVPLVGLLRHAEARQACVDALALAECAPELPETASVWAYVSWQFMLDRDYADSITWGRRASALAERLGDRVALDRALAATGAALLFTDPEAGRRLLRSQVEHHRARGDVLGTATALNRLGIGLGEVMALHEAETCLREGVELMDSLDASGQYARAWLALVLLALGRWDEAGAQAQHVLTRAGVDEMSTLMATLALARLRLRRGDPGVDDALATSRRLAEPVARCSAWRPAPRRGPRRPMRTVISPKSRSRWAARCRWRAPRATLGLSASCPTGSGAAAPPRPPPRAAPGPGRCRWPAAGARLLPPGASWVAPTSRHVRWPRATPRGNARRWPSPSVWAPRPWPSCCAAAWSRPACAVCRAARGPARRRTRPASRWPSSVCWRCWPKVCAMPRSPSACTARCAPWTTTWSRCWPSSAPAAASRRWTTPGARACCRRFRQGGGAPWPALPGARLQTLFDRGSSPDDRPCCPLACGSPARLACASG